tara:strand:+ start:451 stop:1353 length:903 start_codon:yes stop_codon:yes gene_type:complete
MGTNWTNSLAGQTSRTKLIQANSNRANIEFYNINTAAGGKKAGAQIVVFKGFLTSFSDTYNVNFNEEAAYGRMDPFRIYQNTVRTLSLAWDIPAWDADEARANLVASSELTKMLYPSYGGVKGHASIIGSPIIRLKFANIISKGDGLGNVTTSGLAGYIPNLVITPVVENGYFEERGGDRSGDDPPAGLRLYPKLLQMNCSFNVIHEDSLGWTRGDPKWRGEKSFPYGVDKRALKNELTKESVEVDGFVALPGSLAGQDASAVPPVEEPSAATAGTDPLSDSEKQARILEALTFKAGGGG